MDETRQIQKVRNALAEAGFEVLPDDIVAAENRLLERGVVEPNFRQYLEEILGPDWLSRWCDRVERDFGVEQCRCPRCGTVVPHRRGIPCLKVDCPRCGSKMVGDA